MVGTGHFLYTQADFTVPHVTSAEKTSALGSLIIGAAAHIHGPPARPPSSVHQLHVSGRSKRVFASSTAMRKLSAICRSLLRHAAPCALSLARERAGRRSAAKIPIIAITTRSSI